MATFDAVLLISFGGPQGPGDIRPFLANVLRGRRIPPERIEEVAHHYELFGGVSPITRLTQAQADGLKQRLAAAGVPLPVQVGMRNWHPYLADTLAEMSRAGVRRAVGFIMAAQSSYSSCQQYRENVLAARQAIRDQGLADVEITYVPGWHLHDGFIDSNADHVREARSRLPAALQSKARLIFTAHSIPVEMAARSTYAEQLLDSAREVARRVDAADWVLVYQSRSGRPDDPWLGPDICDYLRASRGQGLEAAVLCPIGFVCDHIEVLYDLDREAAHVARDIGLAMTRADAVNDDPRFMDTMADVVLSTLHRYASGRPLPLLHGR
ncbi:MAG TPA: ferrochelatase [Vicinamibacterales bacterium]|nr:ferrochelatase [Vicinamibacterales bacterium]